ncbi:hypothetical protein [Paenibacillus chitinolyticus]|uniref:hypothetical protein n=1 Tax=Paenibacillus chitinolyticus TaxID=79263 RepID=UPI00365474B2
MSQQITEILTQLVLGVLTAVTGIIGVVILVLSFKRIPQQPSKILLQMSPGRLLPLRSPRTHILRARTNFPQPSTTRPKSCSRRGINVDRQKLIATIESAWMQYNTPVNKIIYPTVTVNSSVDNVQEMTEKITNAIRSNI